MTSTTMGKLHIKRKIAEAKYSDDEIPSKIQILTKSLDHVENEMHSENCDNLDEKYVDDEIPIGKINSTTTIHHLPNEMLLEIFSKLDDSDIILTVCNVCQKWFDFYGQSKFFTAEFSEDTSTSELDKCYNMCTYLDHCTTNYKKDLKAILNKAPLYCDHLRSSDLKHCWGWRWKPPLSKNCLIFRIIKHDRVGVSPWKCKRRQPYQPQNVRLFETPVSFLYKQNCC